jgi:hypothetical protein
VNPLDSSEKEMLETSSSLLGRVENGETAASRFAETT